MLPADLEADPRYFLGLDRSEAEYLDGSVPLHGRHSDGEWTVPRVDSQSRNSNQPNRAGNTPPESPLLCHGSPTILPMPIPLPDGTAAPGLLCAASNWPTTWDGHQELLQPIAGQSWHPTHWLVAFDSASSAGRTSLVTAAFCASIANRLADLCIAARFGGMVGVLRGGLQLKRSAEAEEGTYTVYHSELSRGTAVEKDRQNFLLQYSGTVTALMKTINSRDWLRASSN